MSSEDALSRRMALTLAGILAVNTVFGVLVGALLVPWIDRGLARVGAGTAGAVTWIAVVLGVCAALVLVQAAYVRHAVLGDVAATTATDETHPELVGTVRRLAALAGVRTPEVAVVEDGAPNCCSIGGLGAGTIVVSERLLEALEDDELEAVLAHEVAHLLHRDAAVVTLATFLPALASGSYAPTSGWSRPARYAAVGVSVAALYVLAVPLTGGSPAVFLGLLAVVLLVCAVALGVLATPIVFLTRRLSRDREFAADRRGGRLCGSPAALAGALERLADHDEVPRTDKRSHYAGVRSFCLLPYGFDEGESGAVAGVELQTHPPLDERLELLGELAAELESV